MRPLALVARRSRYSRVQQHAGETLTVIVNTFKRLDLLKNSVQHYSACPVVSRVHVNWAESTTPPDVEKCKCCETEVTFALPLLTHNDSSLNTRFMPIQGMLSMLFNLQHDRQPNTQHATFSTQAIVYIMLCENSWRCSIARAAAKNCHQIFVLVHSVQLI